MKLGDIFFYTCFAGACLWGFWHISEALDQQQAAAEGEIEEVALILTQAKWPQRGDRLGDSQVIANLGFVTIKPAQGKVFAPFDGEIVRAQADTLLFKTPVLPKHKIWLCNLQKPRLGAVKQGEVIGSSDFLQVATLTRHNEAWAMVDPSKPLLEKLVGGGSAPPSP